MSIRINTHFGQSITSSMLNEKISYLMNENIVISGFEVSVIDSRISISPGLCIVNGAIIESDSIINIPIDSSFTGGVLVVTYKHIDRRVSFDITNTVKSNQVKLCDISDAFIIDIAKKVRTLKELSDSYKSLRDSLLTAQELSFTGEEINCNSSYAGDIHDFGVQGQTIVNSAPLKHANIFAEVSGEGVDVVINNSKVGLVNNISITGSTLHNLGVNSLSNTNLTEDGFIQLSEINYDYLTRNSVALKKTTVYTLIIDVVENTLNQHFWFMNTNYWYNPMSVINPLQTGRIKILITTSDTFLGNKPYSFWFHLNHPNQTTGNIKWRYMVIEGDYTNIDVEYFEGIKSVSEDSELVIDKPVPKMEISTFNEHTYLSTDSLIPSNITLNSIGFSHEIFVDPNTKYFLKLKKIIHGDLKISLCGMTAILGPNNNSAEIVTPTNISGRNYITLSGYGSINDLMITRHKTSSEFADGIESCAENENLKIISSDNLDNNRYILSLELNEPLRSTGRVHDTIEFINGEWFVIKRNGEIDYLRDSNLLTIAKWDSLETNDYVSFYLSSDDLLGVYRNPILNGFALSYPPLSYKTSHTNESIECIDLVSSSNPPYIGFRILKSRLLNNDSSIKNISVWLKDIKFRLVAPLATHEKIPLKKLLSIKTYNEFTSIYSDNNIRPVVNVKIPTSLGGVIKNDIERISNIEDTIDRILIPTVLDVDYKKTLLEIDYSIHKKFGGMLNGKK